jgi:hypothetical protein
MEGQMKLRRALLSAAAIIISASCVQASDSSVPNYQSAKRAFLKLPLVQRYDLQTLLAAAGYSTAVSTDDFSARIFSSIIKFEAADNLPLTGVVNEDRLRRLRKEAEPILTHWGLKQVAHPSRLGSLWAPVKLVNATQNAPDLQFNGKDNTLQINFRFLQGVGLEATFDEVLKRRAEENFKINYKMVKKDFFVVYGQRNGISAYARYHPVPGGLLGFTVFCSDTDSNLHCDRLLTVMSDLFRASTEVQQPNRTPPTPIATIEIERAPQLAGATAKVPNVDQTPALTGTPKSPNAEMAPKLKEASLSKQESIPALGPLVARKEGHPLYVGLTWSLLQTNDITGKTNTSDLTITELTDKQIVVNFSTRSGGGSWLSVYDRDWNLEETGGIRYSPNNGEGIRKPPTDGETWSTKYEFISRQESGSSTPIPVEVEARVLGKEQIEVPAGKFDAFRIETTSTWKSPVPPIVEYARTTTVWYSPEADIPVKIVQANRQNGHVQSAFTNVLFDGPR